MTEFFMKGSSQDFDSVLKLYVKAVKAKAEQKKKKKGESLQSLDRWMQKELQLAADSRSPPHLNLSELVRLVDWKLSRGKFRPRLFDLAGSNEEEEVIKATGKGLKLGAKGKVEEAIAAIVVLKGIGPATASAILAVCCPDAFCFFADELARAASPSPSASIKYTTQEYVTLNCAVMLCAARLNKDCEEKFWTPHRVELAVWTFCVLEKSNADLLPSISTSSTSSTSSSSFSSSSPPAKKKRS